VQDHLNRTEDEKRENFLATHGSRRKIVPETEQQMELAPLEDPMTTDRKTAQCRSSVANERTNRSKGMRGKLCKSSRPSGKVLRPLSDERRTDDGSLFAHRFQEDEKDRIAHTADAFFKGIGECHEPAVLGQRGEREGAKQHAQTSQEMSAHLFASASRLLADLAERGKRLLKDTTRE
jgi:hypothetical protein